MRRFWQKFLFLTLFGVVFFGGLAKAQESPENQETFEPLTEFFANWASALEEDTPATAVWQFPFGAPRPADLSAPELKIVLSLRRLVLHGNPDDMEALADQVARRQGFMPYQMRFWLAYTQGQLGQRESCLANLESLLMVPDAWVSLEKGQRAWVLTETADLLFLLDQRTTATECYARLAQSPVDQLRLWGQFQLAGMAFLDRDFATAGKLYQDVCEGDKPATWRGHACAMASIADRLSRLPNGGDLHDAVAASGS